MGLGAEGSVAHRPRRMSSGDPRCLGNGRSRRSRQISTGVRRIQHGRHRSRAESAIPPGQVHPTARSKLLPRPTLNQLPRLVLTEVIPSFRCGTTFPRRRLATHAQRPNGSQMVLAGCRGQESVAQRVTGFEGRGASFAEESSRSPEGERGRRAPVASRKRYPPRPGSPHSKKQTPPTANPQSTPAPRPYRGNTLVPMRNHIPPVSDGPQTRSARSRIPRSAHPPV